MKLSAELPARQIPDKPRHAAAPGETSAGRGAAAQAGRTRQAVPVRDLALSLGLPRDALTSSLLSLAKFFSLPLDAKLILRLRREALAAGPLKMAEPSLTAQQHDPEKPDPSLAAPLRSAALAAAAAAGKGVALSPEALGRYAAALAAYDRDDAAPEEDPETETGADREDPRGDGGAPRFSAPREGGDLAEEIEARLPLLGVLNRIPGKDGRRWITLPFSFESGGVVCRVSLRILLADANGVPWKAERMVLDLTTPRRRWSFMLENGGNRACARAVFGVLPPLNKQAERSLRELLGSLAEKVVPRRDAGGAFFEEEAGAEQWEP
jgi:hypothetical protein